MRPKKLNHRSSTTKVRQKLYFRDQPHLGVSPSDNSGPPTCLTPYHPAKCWRRGPKKVFITIKYINQAAPEGWSAVQSSGTEVVQYIYLSANLDDDAKEQSCPTDLSKNWTLDPYHEPRPIPCSSHLRERLVSESALCDLGNKRTGGKLD